ncbi:hypothetical protein CYLTODRAFT_494871 [Cylindrobasidium torrendii FP15055 ss-10]|uniref:Uncharacterized protein n=1 Tax=Cylindrobasidium torrendii FP15055 ss-10 TaxID=1314674 RepID=A0A0D7AW69_9AGAR|nr:hypothetical protein CYLTODRAFT_494871 [Cylindrobasidium torrendii FP15055 ss-10]
MEHVDSDTNIGTREVQDATPRLPSPDIDIEDASLGDGGSLLFWAGFPGEDQRVADLDTASPGYQAFLEKTVVLPGMDPKRMYVREVNPLKRLKGRRLLVAMATQNARAGLAHIRGLMRRNGSKRLQGVQVGVGAAPYIAYSSSESQKRFEKALQESPKGWAALENKSSFVPGTVRKLLESRQLLRFDAHFMEMGVQTGNDLVVLAVKIRRRPRVLLALKEGLSVERHPGELFERLLDLIWYFAKLSQDADVPPES